MPFLMVRNDIVNMQTDAIVNPSNRLLLQGRGTSRGIFLAAGEEELERACRAAAPCAVGEAVITPGFRLQAKYIIHAVCPAWRGGGEEEERLLYSSYAKSMRLARDHGLESIAFPLLSSGNYRYPKAEAMRIAISAIRDFLADHEMTVYLVLYDRKSVEVRKEIAGALEEYLAEHYVEIIDDEYAISKDESYPQNVHYAPSEASLSSDEPEFEAVPPGLLEDAAMMPEPGAAAPESEAARPKKRPAMRERREAGKPARVYGMRERKPRRSLTDLMRDKPETFSEMLIRLIDDRGLRDSDVYNKANIDRRHFSKIKNDTGYVPKKATVFSFAIALELSYDETRDLLMRAGYAFSECSPFDVIIQFFIEEGNYDIFDINEALFHYGQPVLGE